MEIILKNGDKLALSDGATCLRAASAISEGSRETPCAPR